MKQRTARQRLTMLLLLIASLAPAPAAAAPEPICVFLIRSDSGEAIINRCRTCREVTLQRTRLGEAIPNIRAMQLPAENVTPAPFVGPGRTRILGERDCPRPHAERAALGTGISR